MLELVSKVADMLIKALQTDNSYDRRDHSDERQITTGSIKAYSTVLESAGYRVKCHIRDDRYSSVTIGTTVFPV